MCYLSSVGLIWIDLNHVMLILSHNGKKGKQQPKQQQTVFCMWKTHVETRDMPWSSDLVLRTSGELYLVH